MSTTNSKSVMILLVEDDPGDQALTRRALEEGGMPIELRIVEDGEEALEYLQQKGRFAAPGAAPPPDLVLLDLNLPRLDGKQVLERMRADPALRKLPVVALTTSRHEADIARTYELGANSYIAKPVDMDQFVSTLRELGNYWFRLVLLPTRDG